MQVFSFLSLSDNSRRFSRKSKSQRKHHRELSTHVVRGQVVGLAADDLAEQPHGPGVWLRRRRHWNAMKEKLSSCCPLRLLSPVALLLLPSQEASLHALSLALRGRERKLEKKK